MRGLSPSSNMCSDMRSTRYIEGEKDRGREIGGRRTYICWNPTGRDSGGGEGGPIRWKRERSAVIGLVRDRPSCPAVCIGVGLAHIAVL
jgi:hypothetical protein